MVLLTFWYSDCQYCAQTFPMLEAVCGSEPQAQTIWGTPGTTDQIHQVLKSHTGDNYRTPKTK